MFSNEQLISPDFDEVAYLRYALRAANHSAEHERLESCIAEVKRDIQSMLAEHADSLIDQARCTYKTQREVTAVRQSTDSLQKASGRLRIMIEEPYMQLQSRVKELEATQEVMQLLQSTLRFLSLTARLQEQLTTTSSVDIVRSSYTLKELEEVLQDGSVRSLQVVEAQLPAVERHATTIRSKAHELLAMTELTAPPSGNGGAGDAAASTSRLAIQVSTGLQCAYVLRMLSRTVQSFMTERRREVLRTIMRELDAQAIEDHISSEYDRLSRSSLSGHSGAVSEQAVTAHVVLQHIQKTLFIAVQHTRCVILLWRLLLQRRDTQTQELYLFSIDSPVQLLVEYWSTITEKLRERLNSLQKRHTIRLALGSAYPRYHHLVASFLSRTDVAGVAEGLLSTGAPGGAVADSLGSTVTGGAGTAAALLSIHVTQCGMGDYLDLINAVDAAVRRGVAGNEGEGTPFKTPDKPPSSAHIGTATPPRTDTQDMRHTWLAQVTDEARGAFRTHVLDRHREVISGVFSRLSAVVPPSAAAAGQTSAVAPVRMQGSRRPSIPPQANTLDMAVYTRLVTQEVQMFRQDPHTLDVLLDCVFSTLRQVRAKLTEAIKKYPLPPLPAVTAAPTLTQVMHLCIANSCTTLAYDCAAVLAMVPHPSASQTASGAGAGGATAASNAASGAHRHAHQDPYALVLEQLGTKRMELQQLIDTFHNMSERSTKPFADSAASVLLPTLTQAVDNVLRNELTLSSAAAATAASEGRVGANPAMPLGGSGGGDSRTALLQLQSQCRQFTDRFFFLVDARTSGWMEACQHVMNTMLARLLIRLATTPPPPILRGTPLATAPAYAHTLQVMMPPLLQFVQMVQSVGTVGRITSLLRGCVRQVELFYETCGGLGGAGSGDGASAAAALRTAVMERLRPPIPFFFAKLLVLQYGLFTTAVSAPSEDSQGAAGPSALAGALRLSEQGLLECLEGVLLKESSARATAASSNLEGGGAPAAGATGADHKGEVLSAVDGLFLEVVAVAPSESAACLQELWASVQEK
ncbi:conserved hypothetical protein [Leishmania mexicana MHOM/GT/2001/U1103]|uniref:Conserved oligomeric Golgi complex subunit 5 n=1 Tax=Leishmania mexicana (strain MHOM/GT/2001/U1103) TaxID=929439 RepID=E9B3A2_LEIMU|nr:conserved hypothetical protein [Leishmania mexicana MHOM/GT/2001/U1103]CBZ29719.1 conserved hypothetical protein [Leishmania mexicana MHOM/GT/2001/U1103]